MLLLAGERQGVEEESSAKVHSFGTTGIAGCFKGVGVC